MFLWKRKTVIIFLILLFFFSSVFWSETSGTKPRSEFDTDQQYISHPGNIPSFENFTTPIIIPGESGILNFTIKNRYNLPLRNVYLALEIYHWARIDDSSDISEISEPPYFFSSTNSSTLLSLRFGLIKSNETVEVREKIKTKGDTREGTYFVRTMLTFTYNNTSYVMKSRGHFSKELWNQATSEPDEHEDTGTINLTLLGVDGIIPETTFSVRKPVAIWPIYVFAGLTIFFAALAIFVYLIEEEVYPKLNKRVEECRRKLNKLWFSLKNRKSKS